MIRHFSSICQKSPFLQSNAREIKLSIEFLFFSNSQSAKIYSQTTNLKLFSKQIMMHFPTQFKNNLQLTDVNVSTQLNQPYASPSSINAKVGQAVSPIFPQNQELPPGLQYFVQSLSQNSPASSLPKKSLLKSTILDRIDGLDHHTLSIPGIRSLIAGFHRRESFVKSGYPAPANIHPLSEEATNGEAIRKDLLQW